MRVANARQSARAPTCERPQRWLLCRRRPLSGRLAIGADRARRLGSVAQREKSNWGRARAHTHTHNNYQGAERNDDGDDDGDANDSRQREALGEVARNSLFRHTLANTQARTHAHTLASRPAVAATQQQVAPEEERQEKSGRV